MHDRLITRCNKTHVTTPPNRSSVSYSIFVNEIWVTQTEEGRHNDTPTPSSLSFPAAPQLFESDEFTTEFFRRPLKNNRRKSTFAFCYSCTKRSNVTDRLRMIAREFHRRIRRYRSPTKDTRFARCIRLRRKEFWKISCGVQVSPSRVPSQAVNTLRNSCSVAAEFSSGTCL